jgi:hypothetical protein
MMDQNDSKCTIRGNQLLIGNSIITFDFPIVQVIEVTGMLVLRLEVPVKVIYNENVFGVSVVEKKVKWRIAKKTYKPNLKSCPFVGIKLLEGQLILYNWCDTYFVLDPLTGEILKEGWTK